MIQSIKVSVKNTQSILKSINPLMTCIIKFGLYLYYNIRYMKSIILTGSFLVLPFFLFSQTRPDPPRLKRADSFFGVHFDFHAGPDCNEIGKNVDEAMIENIVGQVKPDFIQVDCKGHAGYSSYPTKVGNPAPGFVKDQLKMWRQVTAKNGIALYMHYSGVWDTRAIQFHPSWAAVNADGTLSKNNTSVFGPYADSLLIPQLKELSNDYGVDGVWIDGDCWAHQVDYSAKAEALFTQKTGITRIPMNQEISNWREFLNFNRQGFRDYVTHYTNELHKFNPDFQVASNWAFSTLMPEPRIHPGGFHFRGLFTLEQYEQRQARRKIHPQPGKALGSDGMGIFMVLQ